MRNSDGATPTNILSEGAFLKIYNLNKYKRYIYTLYIYWYLFYFRTFTTEINWNIFVVVFFGTRSQTRDVIPVHSDRGYCIISSQMWQQKHVPWLFYDIYTELIQCPTIFITHTRVCFDHLNFIGVINRDTSWVLNNDTILLKPHNLFNAIMN